MTHIVLRAHSDGTLYGFSCRGHAEFAKAGRDIVCAAVSFLSTTCANALESVAGVKPEVSFSSGEMIVTLSDLQLSRDVQIILKTFEQGMRDMQNSYPDNVHFTSIADAIEQERNIC